MASKIKVDTLETADGTGSIALSNQFSGMTTASLPTTGTLPALDGSALTNLPASGLSSKLISFSRDSATASGTQAITGVGFQPTSVIFIASQGVGEASIGLVDSSMTGDSLTNDHNRTANQWTAGAWYAKEIQLGQGPGNVWYYGYISSYDSDGFTLTWTRTSTPTGTIQIRALCFK